MSGPRRYPRAPWLIDNADLVPQGDPETVVFLPDHQSLLGLHIRGLGEDVMLGIREDSDGAPVTCVVANEVRCQIEPQSNPRRHDDDEWPDRDSD